MAAAHINIHLQRSDVPSAWRLESGRVCVWIDGPNGISLIGSDEELAKLCGAITRALAKPQSEAA